MLRRQKSRRSNPQHKVNSTRGKLPSRHVIVIAALVVVGGICGLVWYGMSQQPKPAASQQVEEFRSRLPKLEKATKDNPNDVTARRDYAVALYATGDKAGAKRQYEQAIKLASSDASLHNNLGNVQRDLKEYDKATQSYDKALELNPKLLNAYTNKASMQLYQMNDAKAAISTYQAGLKQLPDEINLLTPLMIAQEKAGDKAGARQTIDIILKKDSSNKAALAAKARVEE